MRTNKSLTFHEKLLKNIKAHKKHVTKHAGIGLVICLLLLVFGSFAGQTPRSGAEGTHHDDRLTMTFAGDIMMGRSVKKATEKKGYDYPFRYVRPYFQNTDFLTANFENPVVLNKGYDQTNKNIHLKADRSSAKELKHQGFDVVNLANNHTMDYGPEGLVDSLNTFNNLGIQTVGAGANLRDAKQIVYKKVNGYKIAVLGFTDAYVKGFRAHSGRPGILPAKPNDYIPRVHEAKKNADIVLVHMHWGQEYDSSPSQRQKDMAHAIIDEGADVIIGAHPHVLQPVEFYKKGTIFYSLGNFVFDQGWSRTSESALAQYKITKDGSAKVEINPMHIKGTQPRPVQGPSGAYRRYKIYSEITEGMVYGDKWKKTWDVSGNKIVHTINNVSDKH